MPEITEIGSVLISRILEVIGNELTVSNSIRAMFPDREFSENLAEELVIEMDAVYYQAFDYHKGITFEDACLLEGINRSARNVQELMLREAFDLYGEKRIVIKYKTKK